MDGNKDEALKCLKIGKDALNSGDISRARKFISKAQRLDPTLLVGSLISELEGADDRSPSSPIPEASKVPNRESNLRSRSNRAPSSVTTPYTEEQIAIVTKINKTGNYYDILRLDKSCSVEEVRKAYRKLSLKVHPDKNHAPGAEDAFKAVSKAFQCLSNNDSRRQYDTNGSDEFVSETHSNARRYQSGGGGFNGYYEEFDPDEIFRQFFYGMQASNSARHSSFNDDRSSREQAGWGLNMRMIQLLPIVIFALFQLLPSSEPMYSLSRSYPFEERLSTVRGVNYYVKNSIAYNEKYPENSRKRRAVESKVEKDNVQLLAHNCRYEIQRKQWGYVSETPHCEMWKRFDSS